MELLSYYRIDSEPTTKYFKVATLSYSKVVFALAVRYKLASCCSNFTPLSHELPFPTVDKTRTSTCTSQSSRLQEFFRASIFTKRFHRYSKSK